MTTSLTDSLIAVVGDGGYLAGDDIGPRYHTAPRGTGEVRPALVLRPATTAELSAAMKLCHAADQPVTAQVGMTTMIGAGSWSMW